MKIVRLHAIVCIIMFGVLNSWSQLRVTTTTTDLAALVETIGGDLVDVTSLSRPLQDAHYLDATPGMVVRISRSDLFVENGFELETGWVPEVLRETRNRRVRRGGEGHVDASNGIQAIQIPQSISRDQGDVHPSGNPHYTLEPVLAQQAARNIADGLIRVDGANSETYLKNLEQYIERSNEIVEKWVEKFEPYSGTSIIIYHKHFDYMLKTLGLDIVDAIEPLPGIAPSAGHVATLLSTFDSESVRAVIMEPWHDQRVGKQVAEGIGVDLVVGCPSVGSCDGANCVITLFETNAAKIYEAINATGGN
ncbi:metal ABC transporter substrate-binding protein [Chitinispirillales bacterium ANBcel5]|uniref:metal ABC transporter substrate-binding protein n=1 Tax=Cellulosispirillum alkaliphilum TaxID=3039283 RepID=UPI002A55EAD3|nr:metal ABC transporter substrate-binding protein [Chitinispirillales bacterium ANBcel5]